MNKFGIKVYGNNYYIDDIYFQVNSINEDRYSRFMRSKYRMIDSKLFGIELLINKHKLNE